MRRIILRAAPLLMATILMGCAEDEAPVGPPRMQETPNPPDHPQMVTGVNGLTGDVEIAAGSNVIVTESENTITISSGPRVVYGRANLANYTVTPSDAASFVPFWGKYYLTPHVEVVDDALQLIA